MSNARVAADFMRRKLVTLMPETEVLDGISRLLRASISGAPVIDSQRGFLGVFSEKCSMNALTEPIDTACAAGTNVPKAREFMVRNLVTLRPEQDVFEAVDQLLTSRVSGMPVVDEKGDYLGVFSEKTAMRVLIAAIYDQMPGTAVRSYMDLDRNRIINADDSLLDVAHKFQQTPYRRLIVLHDQRLIGQICRRDVLNAEYRVACELVEKARTAKMTEKIGAMAMPRTVSDYMDVLALTTHPNTDVLGITQMFLNSPYRRLPIVENGKLVGQVSRRDVLQVASDFLRPHPHRRRAATLYLSSLHETPPASMS